MTGSFTCAVGPVQGTSCTCKCTLGGEVNPFNITNTKAWFQWGKELNGTCSLGSSTSMESLVTQEALVKISVEIEDLRPNSGFCYQVTGTDRNSEAPERLTGVVMHGKAPAAGPVLSGKSSASFVKSTSAVLTGSQSRELTD